MKRAAAAAAVVVFLGFVAQFWHPVYGFTSFLRLDSSNDDVKIAAFKARPIYVYRDGGYDGLYYAQLAYHPALTSPELARALDNAPYRARRILAPALAWLLALGRPGWIVHVYSVLNVAAWLALAAILWRLIDVSDLRGWLAWFGVLFCTGAISSVRLALTDLVALSILAAALLYAERSRGRLALALAAAAGLARETSLAAGVALVRPPWLSWRNVLRLAAVAAPLAAWLLYIRWVFGANDSGLSNFAEPFAGIVGKVDADIGAVWQQRDSPLAWTTLLATCGLIAQAAYFAVAGRAASQGQATSAFWRMGAAYAVMMMFLGTAVWEGFPGAATRVLLPMSLAFNVLASRRRAALVWLIAGNLTVWNSLVVMRDVPHDPRELAAWRTHGTAVVVHAADGWFDAERSWRHVTAWSRPDSTMDLDVWPRDTQTVAIQASARTRERPLVVTITQDGRVLWRGTVFPNPTPVAFSCTVRDGRARLELSANAPGVRDAPDPAERPPMFAIEDLRPADTR